MTLPQHTTTVLTRAELQELVMRRWDHVPTEERRAIHRERLARMRAEREARRDG
jgi:hypothetical protein